MSATYRQSALVTKQKIASDPENVYLSRAPRIRLNAEFVKDHIMASSGLLNREIGGPSIKPYQPAGIWEASTSGRGQLAKYVQDHDEKLYRRGMYTFIKRTAPPPSMLTFDASNRDQCEVKRLRTNTPLQALILLNDPMVQEAARVLAERLMQANSSPEEMLRKAFRLIVCRMPKDKELELVRNYFETEKKNFAGIPAKASSVLNVGEYRHENVQDKTSLAALMQTIVLLYNTDEAITK